MEFQPIKFVDMIAGKGSHQYRKNTNNWYTTDALGAIFAIFTILDTFSKINCWIYFKNVDAVGDLGPGGLSCANCG